MRDTARSGRILFALALLALALASSTYAACPNRLPYAVTPEGFCPFVWAQGLNSPRGMARAANNDLLVVEQSSQQVTVLWDDNGNGVSDEHERALLAKADGLNHAVLIHGLYLYASSASTVYRWPYRAGVRQNLGTPEVVVNSIPTCCDHVTRAIVFDSKGRFYVQLGSGSNVDPNSDHARIHRFNITSIPKGGFNWSAGEIFADGLRNEVGLRFDKQGRLWGVENGIDNVFRADLGGDIHINNPSEELNLFFPELPGLFYGYPYCWSQYNLTTGKPPGTQWATDKFIKDGTHTDAWCQNPHNVQKPQLNLQAHYAPLDIFFYDRTNSSRLPADLNGDAFISAHGSWNRNPPVGFRVLHVFFDKNGMPIKYEPFLAYQGPGDTGDNWPHRPVGLDIGRCVAFGECLYVSSDASGVIIAVGYESS